MLAIGSDGDVNPMVVIARHLAELGHDVELLANGYFAERVESAGLRFFPLGDASLYENALRENADVWNAWKGFDAIWRILYESIPLTYEVLNQRLTPDTIMVGTSLAHAARVTQELTGTKLVTVHLSPTAVISAHTPPVGPTGAIPEGAPLFIKRGYVELLDRFLLDKACRRDINLFRGQFSLPPIKNVFTKWAHSPDRVIMAWPQWFAPPQPDWPPNSVCTGFPVYEHSSSTAVSEGTMNFIRCAKTPIVVFTAGSAMAQSAEHFRAAKDSLSGQQIRGIFVSRFADQIPESLTANLHHSLYEPFDKLFQYASAVQHHGGIGTSVQCVRAGKPQLIVPYAHDQFDNALRFEKLNVARSAKINRASEWLSKLKVLLSDRSVEQSCAELQLRMRGDDALQLISAAILSA